MLAIAGYLDISDGSRIWIPPTGRPYWCAGPRCLSPYRAGPDLTDDEIERWLKGGAT